jgi:hypothetical protein
MRPISKQALIDLLRKNTTFISSRSKNPAPGEAGTIAPKNLPSHAKFYKTKAIRTSQKMTGREAANVMRAAQARDEDGVLALAQALREEGAKAGEVADTLVSVREMERARDRAKAGHDAGQAVPRPDLPEMTDAGPVSAVMDAIKQIDARLDVLANAVVHILEHQNAREANSAELTAALEEVKSMEREIDTLTTVAEPPVVSARMIPYRRWR